MAMLAEKKKKIKWSQDPRNTNWTRDRSKYGYRMLEQMGWTEGKGLGKQEDGDTEHIRINKKACKTGVGGKRSRDEGWLEHQDAFDKILANLSAVNSNNDGENKALSEASEGPREPAKTLVENATASKKIVYKKFLRSKDLSVQREEDLECVLGTKKRKQVASGGKVVAVKGTTMTTHGITTVTQSQSIQDYFSGKMKSLKDKESDKRTKKKSKKSRQSTD